MKLFSTSIILLMALMLRIYSPTIFSEPGNDIPLHIAHPLHLNQAWTERGLAGLAGQSLRYIHGYSTINTLHLLYGITFTLFGIPIAPLSVAGIHSLIGIASLIVLFLFLKRVVPFWDALCMVILVSLTPIHVGMSATNAGYQIFKMAALFLSFWRLQAWCQDPIPRNRLYYALSLFFAIGSSTDFFVIPALNVLFAWWLRKTPECATASGQRLWSHGWLLLFCWLPCLILIGFALYTRAQGEQVGVLAHIASLTGSGSRWNFTPFLTFQNLLMSAGPLTLLSPIAILILSRKHPQPWERTLMVYWVVMLLTISCSSRAVWTAHILNLATPSIIITYRLLRPYRMGRLMLILGGVASLILTALIIFRVGDLPLRKTYGSRSLHETGIEARGQIIRSRQIPVTQDPRALKLKLVVDFEGAWFYLGSDIEGPDFLSSPAHESPDTLYVVRPGIQSNFNLAIANHVKGWPVLLEITDQNRVIMQVFESGSHAPLGQFQAQLLKREFWKSYHLASDFTFAFIGQ